MSYILDALRKSQQQRRIGQVPTLDSDPPPAPTAQRPRSLGTALSLGVAALALAVAIAGHYTRNGAGVAAVPAPQLAAEMPVEAVAAPSRAPVFAEPAPRAEAAAKPRPATPLVQAPPPPPPGTVAEEPAPAVNPWRDDADAHILALAELPEEVRRGIPPLEVNVHVYASHPQKRFVFINNGKYGEGEVTREGVRVEAITPTGLVLSYASTRFRMHL